MSTPATSRVPNDIVESAPFEWLARAGFVARGAVYGIIGLLALKLALGVGGKTTNQQGAMRTLAEQPFGKTLLVLLAIGLAGYAIWRLVRAALGRGPESVDSGFDRVGALASGIVYLGLFLIAVEVLVGAGGGSSKSDPKQTTAGVLGWPAGRWLVLAVAAVLVGVGLYQGYRGISRKFLDDSKREQMSEPVEHAMTWIGTVGHLARMVVFVLIGIFLGKAAIEYDPQKAIGLDGALAKLAQQGYGHVLLGVVAAGLIAFAAYSLLDARYRRI